MVASRHLRSHGMLTHDGAAFRIRTPNGIRTIGWCAPVDRPGHGLGAPIGGVWPSGDGS
jgi:hypothetical protein